MKYLGNYLDILITFEMQLKESVIKLNRVTAKLCRRMPSCEKRRVVCAVTNSIILYGAPIASNMLDIIGTPEKTNENLCQRGKVHIKPFQQMHCKFLQDVYH